MAGAIVGIERRVGVGPPIRDVSAIDDRNALRCLVRVVDDVSADLAGRRVSLVFRIIRDIEFGPVQEVKPISPGLDRVRSLLSAFRSHSSARVLLHNGRANGVVTELHPLQVRFIETFKLKGC